MKIINKLLTKLNLRYQSPNEEQDYLLLKLPLVHEFAIYLFVAIGFQWAPLIIRYFMKNLVPQNYIAICLTILGIILIIFRKRLGKAIEYAALGYLFTMMCLSIVNTHLLIAKVSPTEAFYMGYTSAMLPRLLGYRIVKFQNMLILYIFGIILRLSLIPLTDPVLTFIFFSLEFFTMVLNFRSEIAERKFFDSLYKSKNQLLKFKHLLTENLPNQIAIFSKDFIKPLFINKPFQKTFQCGEDMGEIRQSFDGLIIEKESLEKNRGLLSSLQLDIPKGQLLDLTTLLEYLSKDIEIMRKFSTLTFQVKEKEEEDEGRETGMPEEDKVAHSHEKASTPKANPGKSTKGEKSPLKRLKTVPCRSYSVEAIDVRINVEDKDGLTTERRQLVGQSSSEETLKKRKTVDHSPGIKPQSEEFDVKKRIFTVKIFLLQWDEDEAIAVLLDNVTHERTIMELKIADKNKDLVITMISHELRTPLNGILGLVDIVKKMLRDTEAMPYLNACKNSGILLLNFVNSILDLSQVRNNKLRLVHSKVSILELLDDIRPLFEYFCQVKKIYLNFEIGDDVPRVIVTDKNRLSQVLINLIGNAIKFTFQGGITVYAAMDEENSQNVKFSVRDTGIGIKNQDQAKLFKLFGRLDHENQRINTHGAGIGLTISNSLALLLGPNDNKGIKVESKFDRGSVFSFIVENRDSAIISERNPEDISPDLSHMENDESSLPLYKKMSSYSPGPNHFMISPINQQESDKSSGIANELSRSRKDSIIAVKPWCLIVDDTPLNLVVASHIMQERGFQTKTALNGKLAIEMMVELSKSGEHFKLVLMDCQMPVMDGYEATKILKEMMRKGEIRECPIVALTAHQEDKHHMKLCQDSGMDGMLGKPLQIAKLMEMLKKIQNQR